MNVKTLPPITICMTTYYPPGEIGERRAVEAIKTVVTWERYLYYSGIIRLHIADDGSAENWLNRLRADAQSRHASFTPITFSQQARHGVGASLNKGFAKGFETGGLVLYMVDDWTLTAPMDLTPWADLLVNREDRDEIGMIRLGPPHPDLTGTVRHDAEGRTGKGRWTLNLDRHHFAFGHRPALYHERMIDHYGWFDEDVNAYDCERLYSERFNAATEGPGIVLALPDPWIPIAEDPELELAHIVPGEDERG